LPAITEAKKRRTINEHMDVDDDKVIPSDYEDNKFVDFVELKNPAKNHTIIGARTGITK
jgi:hypothetical protein